MDGVLLDTERLSRSSFEQTCVLFNTPLDERLFANLTGRSGPAHRQLLTEKYGDAGIEFDLKWKAIYQSSLNKKVPVMSGAAEFLKIVSTCGYQLAVGTSSHTEKAQDYLHRAGLAKFFSLIVGSDQVTNAKPAPDIYLLVMDKLGVKAKNCLIVEDSDNGVIAAFASGAQVAHIPEKGRKSAVESHFTYGSLPELATALTTGKH